MADQESLEIKTRFTTEGDKEAVGAYNRLTSQINQTNKTGETLNKTLAQIRKEADIKEAAQFYGQFAARIGDSEKAANLLAIRLQSIGASTDDIRKAADEFERMNTAQSNSGGSRSGGGTNIGTIGRGLSGIGLSDAGQLANTVDDLKDIYEQFKNIGGVTESVAAGTQAAAVGYAATLTAVLPIAAVAVAGSIALKTLTDTIEAQKKAVDDVVNELKKDTDARLNSIEVIRTATSEQIKSTLEIQKAQLLQVQADKASREAFLADIQRQYKAIEDSGAFDPVNKAALGQAGQVAEQSIADLTAREKELTASIETNTNEILPAIEAREKETDAVKATADSFTKSTKAIEDASIKITNALKERAALDEQLSDVETKRSDQLANRLRDDKRAAETGALEAQILAAQEKEAATEAKNKIIQTRIEGGEAEKKALATQQSKIDAINSNFMASQLKALSSYITAESRATEDYNVNRLRKAQDLLSDLTNLSASRDVSAFVNRRASGNLDLARGDEDAGTASRRRLQDYQTQSAEADANRQKQLSDLRIANEKENVERRAALAKKIDDEKAAQNVQLKQSEILQQQLAALRQKYAAEDLAARRNNEDAAYNTQIGKLKQRTSEINNTINKTLDPAVTFFNKLGTAVVGFYNQVRGASSSGSGVGGGLAVRSQYATGTPYVPEDGIYKLHKGERVVTAAENRNYIPSSSRNSGLTVVIQTMNVGDIATPGYVENQFKMFYTSIGQYSGAPTN